MSQPTIVWVYREDERNRHVSISFSPFGAEDYELCEDGARLLGINVAYRADKLGNPVRVPFQVTFQECAAKVEIIPVTKAAPRKGEPKAPRKRSRRRRVS